MEKSKVDAFLLMNSKNLPEESLENVRQMLLKANEEQGVLLQMVNLKNPKMLLAISLLGGSLGLDRFVLGETSKAVLKLFTCGGAGIWTIVDWFLIMKATKQKNLENLMAKFSLI